MKMIHMILMIDLFTYDLKHHFQSHKICLIIVSSIARLRDIPSIHLLYTCLRDMPFIYSLFTSAFSSLISSTSHTTDYYVGSSVPLQVKEQSH